MPASKKRSGQQRATTEERPGPSPTSICRKYGEWVNIWHGVKIHADPCGRKLFHSAQNDGPESLNSPGWIRKILQTVLPHARLNQLLYLPRHEFLPPLTTVGNPRHRYKDGLYILLNMPWTMLLMVCFMFYFFVIGIFGLSLIGFCHEDLSVFDAFNLSFHTFATIGYGNLIPVNRCANYMITVEAFSSMIILSMLTGLVFAKFAKPKAKVAFSKVAVIQPYGPKYLALVLRAANATHSSNIRNDVIMETSFKVSLLRIELQPHDPTVLHHDDKFEQHQDFLESDMVLHLVMSGVDSTLQDTVTDHCVYTAKEIKWGQKFEEMLEFDESQSSVMLDFAKLSKTSDFAIPENASYCLSRRHLNHSRSISRSSSMTDVESNIDDSDEMSIHELDQVQIETETTPLTPQPSNFNIEPLFEPLLNHPMGHQRLSSAKDTPCFGPNPKFNHSPNYLSAMSPTKVPKSTISPAFPASSELSRWHQQLSGQSQENVPVILMDDEVQVHSPQAQKRRRSPKRRQDLKNHRSSSRESSNHIQHIPRFSHIVPKNIPGRLSFLSLYYQALHIKWTPIFFIFIFVFTLINGFFGSLYYLKSDEFQINDRVNVRISNFEAAFFFSVHTLSTIGFGSITPTSNYLNFWVAIEATIGLIVVTLLTGISWAKFARPRAHILFSQRVLITEMYGQRCLVFRAANTRHHGDIRESTFRIGVMMTDGKTGLRQLYHLPLLTETWLSFALSATLIHVIDDRSPFVNIRTAEDISRCRIALLVLFTGLDTTFSESVYARKMYFWDEFAFHHEFRDVVVFSPGSVTLDFKAFNSLRQHPDHVSDPFDEMENQICSV